MRTAHVLSALCATLVVPARTADFDLSNWMGGLRPMIDSLALLDMSVPGSHDTTTYDLSKTISDDANDLPPALASFLHDFSWILPSVTGFVRDQAMSQSANIIDQLDGGVRFIDFRIIYTHGPKLFTKKQWYTLHLVESNNPAVTYLQQIRQWLDDHPQEVLTFWLSRHGNCDAGQFPGITDAEMRDFWGQIEEIFAGLLIDTSVSQPGQTPYADLIARNHRVVMYVAEGKRFYGNKTNAYDGCLVDNRLGGAGAENVQAAIEAYKTAQGVIDADRPDNKYYLKSMAMSSGGSQIGAAALKKYLHINTEVKKCAASYKIPGFTEWCPTTLLEQERMNNYYNQIALESVVLNTRRGVEARYPNAIYLDVVTKDGTILTGVEANATEAYAYSASVVLTNLWRGCGGIQGNLYGQCALVSAELEALRQKHPFQQVDNVKYGRVPGYPVSP